MYSQNTQFSYLYTPLGENCYSRGGNVRNVFLGSFCRDVGGSNISGSAFGLTVQDMTTTFDRNLIIDQHVTFKRYPLFFTSNYGIVILDHHLNIPSPQYVLKTTAQCEECLIQGFDGYMWKGPNPTTGEIQIQSNHPLQKVIIRNIHGDFMESKSVVQETKIELDLSHLAPSVYLVEIQSSTGERNFKKLIRIQ